MERWDVRGATQDLRLRQFGEVLVSIGRGGGKGFAAQGYAQAQATRGEFLHDTQGMIAAAQNTSAMNSIIMRGDVAMLSDPGMSDWVPTSRNIVDGVIEESLLGRIGGQKVELNQGQLEQNVVGSAGWTGEGQQKGATATGFQIFSLQPRKITVICVVSNDMFDLTNAPSLLTTHAQRSAIATLNERFVGSDAGDADAPAGIAHNAIAISSTGNTEAQCAGDIRGMLAAAVDAKASLENAAFITSPQGAAFLRMMRIADRDGVGGIPLVTAASASGKFLLIASSYLAYASGAATIAASRHGDIVLPGTAGETVNLFAQNMTAIGVEMFANWSLRGPTVSAGTGACVTLTSATWA